MKYTAKVEMFATNSPSYIRTIVFDAQDDKALDDLLFVYEEHGEGVGIDIDDSLRPQNFCSSGGFASRLLLFVDENGRDVSYLDVGTF